MEMEGEENFVQGVNKRNVSSKLNQRKEGRKEQLDECSFTFTFYASFFAFFTFNI